MTWWPARMRLRAEREEAVRRLEEVAVEVPLGVLGGRAIACAVAAVSPGAGIFQGGG